MTAGKFLCRPGGGRAKFATIFPRLAWARSRPAGANFSDSVDTQMGKLCSVDNSPFGI